MTNPSALTNPEQASFFGQALDGAFTPLYSKRDDSTYFGIGPWDRGDQLTISFADDGTKILNQESKLYESFGWMLNAEQLQARVIRAFQVWARTTNLNVGQVDDSGVEFGVAGLRQNDVRFGDIRIGAIDMAPDVFAVAIPADELAAGTWAGEVVFNSAADFTDSWHFYQVALHEAGHVLGLEHSDDIAPPMHPHGSSMRITTQDVTNLRSLYGIRGLDVYDEELKNNNSFADASSFDFHGDAEDGEAPLVAFGDIKYLDDDFFRIDLPSGYVGRLTFRVQTQGLSVLAPTVTVFDDNGGVLRHRQSNSETGDSIVLSMPETEEGGRYYVRVKGSESGIFGLGSYAIGAVLGDAVTIGWQRAEDLIMTGLYSLDEQEDFQDALLNDGAFINDDQSTDDDFFDAQILDTTNGFAEQSHYSAQASLANSTDQDFYRVKTINHGVGDRTNMNIVLDTVERNGLIPDVQVFDRNFNLVRTAILINSNGQLSVQARSIEIDRDYYIRVVANDASPAFIEGNYRLDIDFAESGVSFQRFAAGTLTVEDSLQEHTLHVAQSQILHINLLSKRNVDVPNAIIWLTVYDESGKVKFRSATRPGETRSANSVLFTPGSYAIKTELVLPDGIVSNSGFTYLVRGRDISDPQGPKLLDPTDSPFPQCNPGSPEYCYPSDHHSPQPYVFLEGQYVVVDAPSTPWVDINKWYWFENWLAEEVPPL